MKALWTIPTLAALCASALLVSPLYTAASAPTQNPKLDKFIEPIAEAVDEQRQGSLMNRALLRQNVRANSPLEARWNEAGAVQVYLHYAAGGAGPDLTALKQLGATGIVKSDALAVVQAWVPAEELRAAGELPGVERVSLPRYAYRKDTSSTRRLTYTGSVDTQGDTLLGAQVFRNTTGITGKGISVGVISDGDDHTGDSQKSGDLPPSIFNDPNDSNGGFSPKSSGDEGTAMMEIVYDLAPGVKQLGFCGPQSTVDFVTCLNDFNTSMGANVIVDDLGFEGGAMFSDDTFNTAVKSFADSHTGIQLVTAAGNGALGYWQGSWNPASVPTSVNGVSYTQVQNFGTTNYLAIDTSNALPGDQISYQVEWNDPWSDTSKTNLNDDYDVVVFDNSTATSGGGAGSSAVACNQGINIGPASSGGVCNEPKSSSLTTPGPQPIQGSAWTVTTPGTIYYLEVFKVSGNPGPNLKILITDNTNSVPIIVTPGTVGSVFGHATLTEEITAGAFDAQATPLYSIEPFSALGPVEYGVTGGTAQSIQKPDFTGPDDVSITGAGGFENPFFGTSAAAPHLAGLVALLKAGYPGQSVYTLLQKAATQPGTTNPNGTFGFGVPILTNLTNAGDFPPPTATITKPTATTTISTGQQVAFAGSCTANGSSSKVTMDWNFGSNSGITDSSSATPSVTFSNGGSYAVTLTCSDASGKGTASVGITVNAPSKGGGDIDLLALTGLGLIYLARRRRTRA